VGDGFPLAGKWEAAKRRKAKDGWQVNNARKENEEGPSRWVGGVKRGSKDNQDHIGGCNRKKCHVPGGSEGKKILFGGLIKGSCIGLMDFLGRRIRGGRNRLEQLDP